jgi:photosynthetic reaction center H subunit
MSEVTLMGDLDVAELVFYIFFAFFLGLVIYLRREDRREGYPLEEDVGGKLLWNEGPLQRATPKSFQLSFGRDAVSPEIDRAREPVVVPNATREAWPGSPLDPVGNPLTAGVGPGAYAQRADTADLGMLGHPRIVAMSQQDHFAFHGRDPDIRGKAILGADKAVAGHVGEVWVDLSDHAIRYLTANLEGGGQAVVPFAMCSVAYNGTVTCDALLASQFTGAPLPKDPTKLTLLEEEQILGYFGAGYLYASPDRVEPYL